MTYIAAIITINLMGYQIETRHLVYLSAVTMLFDSLHLSIYGTLRAYGNLRYEAIGTICSQFLTMILGTCFLYAGLPLIYLIAAFTIPSFCNVCYSSVILYRNYKVKFLPRYDAAILKFMAKIAVPFALTAIFTRLYAFADSILLSKLAGDEAVGWYSIPYKITFAFQFLPLALGASLFPRFSEYFVSDKQKLARSFEQGMKYLMLIVFPIAIGIGVLAHDIVITLYKEQFINSVLPLQILMVSLVFLFLSGPVSTLLNACDRQVTQTGIIGFVAITNITLNIFLIPRFGVVGAASAALVGNFLILAIGYYFAPKITRISHKYLLKTIFQVAVSAGVMGLVVYQINQISNFLIA
ncbi:MAG: flippase, partial [Patescibacteria group bacterium]